MDIEKKKRLEKKLTIGFQVFAVIGLIVIGFYLGKSFKARKENKEKKEQETIKDFGNKFEEFQIIYDEKYTVDIDGNSILIENKADGVYLNDKKIDFRYAMGGYILDKSLMLYSVGQVGYDIIFIDKELSEIPFDNKKAVYKDLTLTNGKINGTVTTFSDPLSCKYIKNLSICNCGEIGTGEPLIKFKEELEPFRDEVLEGKVILSYDGEKIRTEYTDKQTVWDLYGTDIEGITNKYCAHSYKGDE